jgi:hypothetical protein
MAFSVDSGGTLDTGLVSYYKFDSNSTDSKNAHNGNDVNTPTYTAGKISNALTLNGSNQYTHPSTAFSLGDASYAGWIKTSTDGTRIISEYDTGSSSGWVLALMVGQTTAHKLRFQLINFGVGGSSGVTSTTSVDSGAWVFFAATRSGGDYKIYINGNTAEATTAGGNTTSTNSLITIGGEVYGSTLYTPFNGQLDEFGIWSKALSTTEIGDLYNGGTGNTFTPGTTIVLSQGSFALTGQDMNPLRGLRATLSQGSFALNGQTINALRGYMASLAQGAFTLTGQAINATFAGWTKAAKNAATWTNATKNSASWSNDSKNSSSWTNSTKH